MEARRGFRRPRLAAPMGGAGARRPGCQALRRREILVPFGCCGVCRAMMSTYSDRGAWHAHGDASPRVITSPLGHSRPRDSQVPQPCARSWSPSPTLFATACGRKVLDEQRDRF